MKPDFDTEAILTYIAFMPTLVMLSFEGLVFFYKMR
jgi:hypothetical protein